MYKKKTVKRKIKKIYNTIKIKLKNIKGGSNTLKLEEDKEDKEDKEDIKKKISDLKSSLLKSKDKIVISAIQAFKSYPSFENLQKQIPDIKTKTLKELYEMPQFNFLNSNLEEIKDKNRKHLEYFKEKLLKTIEDIKLQFKKELEKQKEDEKLFKLVEDNINVLLSFIDDPISLIFLIPKMDILFELKEDKIKDILKQFIELKGKYKKLTSENILKEIETKTKLFLDNNKLISKLLSDENKKKYLFIIENEFKKLSNISSILKDLNPLKNIPSPKKIYTNALNAQEEYNDYYKKLFRNPYNKPFLEGETIIITKKSRMHFCKDIKSLNIKLDSDLLSFFIKKSNNLKAIIKDTSYDFKSLQVEFNDLPQKYFWIPSSIVNKRNTLKGGYISKKIYLKEKKKNTNTNTKKFNNINKNKDKDKDKNKDKKITKKKNELLGGTRIFWHFLFPIYGPETTCIEEDETGVKVEKPDEILSPTGASQGGGFLKKMAELSPLKFFNNKKEISAKEKLKEQLQKSKEEGIKLTGQLLQDSAKLIITVFISLVKLLEKNPHFKFIYYFFVNSIYKAIKVIKEIVNYSNNFSLKGKKKTTKYLIYITKIICMNTENFINPKIIEFTKNKINLFFTNNSLEILAEINDLISLLIEKIIDFFEIMCRNNSQIEEELKVELERLEKEEGEEGDERKEEGEERKEEGEERKEGKEEKEEKEEDKKEEKDEEDKKEKEQKEKEQKEKE